MDFTALLDRFTRAACAGDGAGLAACFTEDGTYNDYIYGPFSGRAAIAHMLEHHFHGDARDFKWQMLDPVLAGATGYARYLFSFTSTMPAHAGRRVAVDGMAQFKLAGDKIQTYTEVVNGGVPMAQLGVAPEKMAKVMARWSDRLLARPEMADHRASAV